MPTIRPEAPKVPAPAPSTVTGPTISVKDAGALAKTQAFSVDMVEAKKIVAQLKKESPFAGGQVELMLTKEHGWAPTNDVRFDFRDSSQGMVQVDFPQGIQARGWGKTFDRALLDPKNGEVYLVKVDTSKELNAMLTNLKKPAGSLLGEPSRPRVWVDGPFRLQGLDKTLQLQTVEGGEFEKAAKPKRPPKTDGFTPTEPAKSLSPAKVAAAGRDYVLKFAGEGAGKLFPPVDSGNLGLSSLVLADKQAQQLLKAAQSSFPGSAPLQALKFDPKTQAMLAVITSDDEPQIHLAIINQKTGEVSYVEEFNSIDLDPKDFGLAEDSDEWPLSKIAQSGRWLALGPGSADNNWWE